MNAANNTTTSHNALSKGGSPYIFRFVHRNPIKSQDRINDYVYSFINQKGYKYYVYCHEYSIGVFAVKFCLAMDRKNPNRFKKITNFGDGIIVLKTVISIMWDILNKNKSCSFAFIGMPRENEQNNLTTRYCVYKALCHRYFSSNTFNHYFDEETSFYTIMNKKNTTPHFLNELTKLAQAEMKEDSSNNNPVSFGRSTH